MSSRTPCELIAVRVRETGTKNHPVGTVINREGLSKTKEGKGLKRGKSRGLHPVSYTLPIGMNVVGRRRWPGSHMKESGEEERKRRGATETRTAGLHETHNPHPE